MRQSIRKIKQMAMTAGAAVSVIVAVAFVASAYGGIADPMSSAKLSVLGLCFPIMLVAVLCLLVVWLCLRQWGVAAVLAVAMIASAGPILTLSPVNIGGGLNDADKARSFKVLTYNVMNFVDYTEEGHTPNRTIDFILQTDADLVCLQEAAQADRFDRCEYVVDRIKDIRAKYPYYYNEAGDQVLLSKYPFRFTGDSIDVNGRNKFLGFDVNMNGRHIKVFNCHLESIGLTETDKDLYWKLTQLKRMRNMDDIEEVRETLVSKLAKAFRQRSIQAHALRECIDRAGENVIVCGDFNDTPDSYAHRTVMGSDMSDAYQDCAFGPTITYHSNRFFFRIDHILYRGCFKAVDIKRGKVNCSDHYPLIATFVFK